ncbi:hypothetical protein C8R47DRAFT_1096764 [Mycena vitilis]|nr:hypothetical protein C8R47DRAFT_1096764 [Mycena vitilis]
MSDLHEVQFTWPSTEPTTVIATGSFDEWSSSVHLVKDESGFHGSAKIPWGQKISYKYVVDSNWVCETNSPTEADDAGHVNNVYTSPPKPVDAVDETAAAVANGAVPAPEKLDSDVPADVDPPQHADTTPAKDTTVSDFVDTVAARDGTSSALGYVASAFGAAVQSQFGVDPINADKIALETPKPDGEFNLPEQAAESLPATATEASPMAPVVPVLIVPVNAAENNTSSTETPAADTVTPPVADPEGSASAVIAETEASRAADSYEAPPTQAATPTGIPPADTSNVLAAPVDAHSAVEPAKVAENKISETSALTAPPSPPTSQPSTTAATGSTIPAEPAVPVVPEQPSTNGLTPKSTSAGISTPTTSAPATPAKKNAHAFPSTEAESPSSSIGSSPSKFGTIGSMRKKRQSIFGKFKGLFGNDKEEKEKEKK